MQPDAIYYILNTLITIICFILLYIYQRQKIGSLKTQLETQKDLLQNVKVLVEIFDPNKLKGYTELYGEKIKLEMERYIKGIEQKLEKEQKKHKDLGEQSKYILKEFYKVLLPLSQLCIALPEIARMDIIEKMEDGMVKELFLEMLQVINQRSLEVRKEAMHAAFTEVLKEK